MPFAFFGQAALETGFKGRIKLVVNVFFSHFWVILTDSASYCPGVPEFWSLCRAVSRNSVHLRFMPLGENVRGLMEENSKEGAFKRGLYTCLDIRMGSESPGGFLPHRECYSVANSMN